MLKLWSMKKLLAIVVLGLMLVGCASSTIKYVGFDEIKKIEKKNYMIVGFSGYQKDTDTIHKINEANYTSIEKSIKLKTGIYLALSGPAFETPAEIQAYKTMGVSAVGMSTVPEAIVGNALGFKILGISCITNKAAGISENPLSHEEVNQTSSESLPKMQMLIETLLAQIH